MFQIISAFNRQHLGSEVSVRMGVYFFVEVFPILTAHYQPLATHPLAQNCHGDSLSQVNSSGRHGYPNLSNPPPFKTHTQVPPHTPPRDSPYFTLSAEGFVRSHRVSVWRLSFCHREPWGRNHTLTQHGATSFYTNLLLNADDISL